MSKSYYLVINDKTTCGGIITGGDPNHMLLGKSVARENDHVTCGKVAGLFVIIGYIPGDKEGRKFAGTLHSQSTCPCQAAFVPSIINNMLDSSNIVFTLNESELQQSTMLTDFEMIGHSNSQIYYQVLCSFLALKQNFFISRGDLIYGIQEERAHYISQLHPGYSLENKTHPPLVIDVYNNTISTEVSLNNPKFTTEKYSSNPVRQINNILIPNDLERLARKWRDGDEYLWGAYFRVGKINHKFNIKSIYKEVADNYKKDWYYEVHTGSPGVTGYAPRLLWKRGSKLGIEMTAQNDAIHHLHFVLDGLMIVDIVEKKAPHGISVTASELRYIYRNRDRLQGKIHFYMRGERVRAPWDISPLLWSKYKPSKPSPRAFESIELHNKKTISFFGMLRFKYN